MLYEVNLYLALQVFVLLLLVHISAVFLVNLASSMTACVSVFTTFAIPLHRSPSERYRSIKDSGGDPICNHSPILRGCVYDCCTDVQCNKN
ncbi:MAG: hypothetical protein J6Q10_03020 [Clostridia bacterium]|nr:hypothetical protein [Clostridia bacterium]